MRRFLIVGGIGYVAVLALLATGLWFARRSAHEKFATVDARQAWEEWRQDTQSREAENRPVRRSVPRSSEPPTLVLLRDYFAVCVAAATTLSTVLYWTMAFFVRGVIAGPKFTIDYRDHPKPTS